MGKLTWIHCGSVWFGMVRYGSVWFRLKRYLFASLPTMLSAQVDDSRTHSQICFLYFACDSLCKIVEVAGSNLVL